MNVNIIPLSLASTQSALLGEAIPSHAGWCQCAPLRCPFTLHIRIQDCRGDHGSCVCVCCSPFEVMVGPEAGFQKVRAWGPGLKTGMVGKSADFVVETIGTDVGILGGLPVRERVSR